MNKTQYKRGTITTTMESSQLPSQELKETDKEVVEDEEEDPLQKQLKKLEQEWSVFKQSKSNPLQNTHHYSTDSIVTEDFQLLTENSPIDPMSSLQQQQRRLSPEGYFWNWRQNDKAAVEMLKEGWDSIESSKLKGKRLFEDLSTEEEEEEEDDDDICSECFNLVQESEEGLVFSWGENENAVLDCCYCNSSSSPECEEMVERDVVKETETAVLMKLRNDGMIGHQKIWWGVVIALLGLIFAVYIVSRKFNGGYVEDVTLAPT